MYPVLFKIGAVCIYSYGVMIGAGLLIAAFLCERHAEKRAIPADKIADLIFWLVIFGILGGRIFYVMLNFSYYLYSPAEIFKIYKGGLVFYGSLIFGLGTSLIFIKKNRLPLRKTLDIISIYVPLAHAFGRMGCFLNGCCFGKPTTEFWGVTFPGNFIRLHPVQLYCALLLIVIFFILLFMERRKYFDGQVLFTYFMLYGAMRFFIEFLRGDNNTVIMDFTIFQIISMILFLMGLALYIVYKNKKSNGTIG